jgi:Flp pilus assembly protein TadG
MHTITATFCSGFANRVKYFLRNTQGIALAEFAIMLPVLMTLFYGAIEVTRYILIAQKVEKLAHSVADVTAQSSIVTIVSLNQVLSATSDIMNPYSMGANGRVIISSLYRTVGAADASVNWRYEGGGTLTATSALGAVGATPAMPSGFTFDERENVMAAEVFYRFSPLISSQFFGTTTVYRIAFYKPRLGALVTPPT